jgi:autotransporter-associated beta strand protein
VAGNLTLTYGTPFGNTTSGTSLNITGGHTGNLLIKSTVTNSDAFSLGNITIAANAGALTFGNGTGNDRLTFRGTNTLTNNSANTATFASDVVFFSGGGTGRTLAFGGSGNWQVDAPLTIGSGGSGSFTVTKQGDGTLTLAATNGYTGTTTVNQGTLLATKAVALPGYNAASKVSVANGATLAVRAGGAGEWLSSEIDSVLGATTAAFASGSKLGIDVTTGNTFSYGTNIGTTQVAKGLVKSGAGTLTLSSGTTHTYTGATSVTAGKLIVNGNISTSATTVQNSGILGGSGTLGSVTVQSGGTLAPGNSIDSLGINGGLTLESGSFSVFEINTADNISDLAIISGLLTFGGTLNVNNVGGALVNGDTFDLFNWGSKSGTFSAVNLPGLDPGLTWDQSQFYTNGTLTVVPEPRAPLLGGLGLLALLRRKR